MKVRGGVALALVAWLAVGGPSALSLAGPPGKKCSYETQDCLNKMVLKMKNQGWLGIEYENAPGPDYMRLLRVVPGSPAETAGFLAGDILVSINGAKFADNTEDECVTCLAVREIWKPGAEIEYVVSREGKQFPLSATLASLPYDVMAMMIGMHMIEHANPLPKQ